MQKAHPYFEWNRLLDTLTNFLEKSDENMAAKCWFLAWFDEFKGAFLRNYWRMNITHTKKMCERKFINGIECMNIGYSPRLRLRP